jgi:hypothetical protein
MTKHELKVWPQFFAALVDRTKTFEIRKNDRDFKVGDALLLKEWDPKKEDYTGGVVHAFVSYISTPDSFQGVTEQPVLNPDYVVLGLRPSYTPSN